MGDAGIIIMSVWKGSATWCLPGRVQGIPVSAVRGGDDRRRQRLAGVLADHPPLLSPMMFLAVVLDRHQLRSRCRPAYVMTNGGRGRRTNTIVLYIYQNGSSYSAGYARYRLGLFGVIFIFTLFQMRLQGAGSI